MRLVSHQMRDVINYANRGSVGLALSELANPILHHNHGTRIRRLTSSDLKKYKTISANDVTGDLAAVCQIAETLASFSIYTPLLSIVSNLEMLIELNLPGMDINELPVSIGNLKCLQILNLQVNRISILPSSIGNLTSLKQLDISNNFLAELPESIGQLQSLVSLDISKNYRLATLPDSIGNLISLERLVATNISLEYLPDTFVGLTSLRMIDISNNFLTSDPKVLERLPQLIAICLSGNPI